MHRERHPTVYILANTFQRIYVGVTANLIQRLHQHKHPEPEDQVHFTARYNINKLVYLETFSTMPSAIAREKQIKGWLRKRKLELIIKSNPTWRDLSEDWNKPFKLYNQP